MSSTEPRTQDPASSTGETATRAARLRDWASVLLFRLWRVVVETVGACLRHRVTGLAAEAAFFAVLSVPPLIFALTGAIGYISERYPPAQIADLENAIVSLSSKVLTEDAVSRVIEPTIEEVLRGGRFDVMSLGFFLALWSGSRALNVFVDTITIMHGLGGQRGIVRTRALSFSLYILAMVLGSLALPLVVAGPSLINAWLPEQVSVLGRFYWPVVVLLCVVFLATLYHVAVPVKTNWSFNLPGAIFSLASWIAGSYLLRGFLTATASESSSVFGPLAAPIAVLLWLYLLSIAMLIGAAVNASFDRVFPQTETVLARRGAAVRRKDAAA
ncbi:YihY/virulence factor BrkB family protein [Nocardioides yefusunii]|uniref:YihY/virulence factor BrkB family protein n=1 Tax=Nocardioides yefusunii TaxID=2500546 RepID=A0ABW1QTD2_9ACTN|nr:YihY/virulence factor BrkB family protein [Nocardioides yefusunii]